MDTIVARLGRINLIFRTLVQQVDILETMTPMDFLEFRDLIFSASGFQSYQFRLLENKLGLRANERLPFHSKPYHVELSPEKATEVRAAEQNPSLFDGLDAWLKRTPFLKADGFDFWQEYKRATNIMFQHDERFVNENVHLNGEEKKRLVDNIQTSKKMFESLFNQSEYEARREKNEWRLSYDAIHAALLIQLYREQPIFQLPFRLITEVLNLDSHLTQWRHRHTMMVKRMLGQRIGTGGSSGEDYLKKATEQHKIFEDFYKLTTFYVPKSKRPVLPESFIKKLGFAFNNA